MKPTDLANEVADLSHSHGGLHAVPSPSLTVKDMEFRQVEVTLRAELGKNTATAAFGTPQ